MSMSSRSWSRKLQMLKILFRIEGYEPQGFGDCGGDEDTCQSGDLQTETYERVHLQEDLPASRRCSQLYCGGGQLLTGGGDGTFRRLFWCIAAVRELVVGTTPPGSWLLWAFCWQGQNFGSICQRGRGVLQPRDILFGHDLQDSAVQDIRVHRPGLLWVAPPCTLWCGFSKLNYPPQQLRRLRKREMDLLRFVDSAISCRMNSAVWSAWRIPGTVTCGELRSSRTTWRVAWFLLRLTSADLVWKAKMGRSCLENLSLCWQTLCPFLRTSRRHAPGIMATPCDPRGWNGPFGRIPHSFCHSSASNLWQENHLGVLAKKIELQLKFLFVLCSTGTNTIMPSWWNGEAHSQANWRRAWRSWRTAWIQSHIL